MESRSTVLVMDDTADVAELLRDALGGAGYRVLVAPTPEAGLAIPAAFVGHCQGKSRGTESGCVKA